MQTNDKPQFSKHLATALKVSGVQSIDADMLEVWWGIFEPYSLQAFLSALQSALEESSGRLDPAKVKRHLPDPLGHPSPEEAWNAAPKSESETAYVTTQIMAALAAADDSIERGDMVGARMCFIETYKREVSNAKLRGERAKFWMTDGNGLTHNERVMAREKAMLNANSQGWISKHELDSGLKRLESSKQNQLSLENLSKSAPTDSAVAKENLAKIKKILQGVHV